MVKASTQWLVNWINFVINFTFGALIPIIPEMNKDNAGFAYGSYGFAKVLFFIPAGFIVDKYGSKKSVIITIVLEILAISAMRFLPHGEYIGRTLEGMALAIGTITLFHLFREMALNHKEYSKNVSMGVFYTGLGFLTGPMVSYLLLKNGVDFVLSSLIAINVFTFILYLMKYNTVDFARVTLEIAQTDSRKISISLVIVITIVKFLQIGFHPLMTHWNKELFEFSFEVSGMLFITSGFGFMMGALRPRPWYCFAFFPGIVLLEYSFFGHAWMYFVAMAILSFSFGGVLADVISKLGFSDLNRLGIRNSIWLLVSDISLFTGPVVLWEMRHNDPMDHKLVRISFMLFLSSVAIVLYFYGRRQFGNETASAR